MTMVAGAAALAATAFAGCVSGDGNAVTRMRNNEDSAKAARIPKKFKTFDFIIPFPPVIVLPFLLSNTVPAGKSCKKRPPLRRPRHRKEVSMILQEGVTPSAVTSLIYGDFATMADAIR